MKKRFTFKCWNCNREYTLFKEITGDQVLFVCCPFCGKEAEASLDPYITSKKTILRGGAGDEQSMGYEYNFPEVIPTREQKE